MSFDQNDQIDVMADRVLLGLEVNAPSSFPAWDYGCGVALCGLLEMARSFNFTDIGERALRLADQWLNELREDVIYKLLAKGDPVPIPRIAIGDHIGSLSSAFVARAAMVGPDDFGPQSSSDLFVAARVLNHFVLNWGQKLPDGTISRDVGWSPDWFRLNHPFVWADDSYLGTVLAHSWLQFVDSHSWRTTNPISVNTTEVERFLDVQVHRFPSHLMSKSGSLMHGFNFDANETSCCRWSRANGWFAMALDNFLQGKGSANQNRKLLDSFVASLLRLQDQTSGLWHQVLDVPGTFVETSGSAMFVTLLGNSGLKFARQPNVIKGALSRALVGLNKVILSNGTVVNICEGTGVQASVADYEARGRKYSTSGPGIGAVLKSIATLKNIF